MYLSWIYKNSPTRVCYRSGSRNEMRWSPFIEGLWIAKMQADHTLRTITCADEIKLNEMNEMSVVKRWNEIWGRGKRKKKQGIPIQIPLRPPRFRDGVSELRTRCHSGGRRPSNRLRNGIACNWDTFAFFIIQRVPLAAMPGARETHNDSRLGIHCSERA